MFHSEDIYPTTIQEKNLDAEVKRLSDRLIAARQALREIAEADPVDLALDPTWSQRIAREALKEADIGRAVMEAMKRAHDGSPDA